MNGAHPLLQDQDFPREQSLSGNRLAPLNQYDRIFSTDIVCIGHSSLTASDHGVKTKVEYMYDKHESMKVALVLNQDGTLIGGQVLAARLGGRVGYEILDRVDKGVSLQELPLTKGRHERLLEVLRKDHGVTH